MLIPLADMIKEFKMVIRGVLHVGAHECEELGAYLKEKINFSKIYWIEAQEHLVKRMKEQLPEINIYNSAISNIDGEERDFIVTNNYQSSSLLELKEHLVEHPGIHEIDRKKVKTERLASLIKKEKIDMNSVNFLNIDIQGMELECLKSMDNFLENIDYIYTEVNIKELYKDCARLGELDSFLIPRNFVRVKTSMTEYGWGDALYIRKMPNFFYKYPNEIFVETGSLVGDGIQKALDAGFKKVISYEVDTENYKKCVERFKGDNRVILHFRSSANMILEELDRPCTFWLDGHHSGGGTSYDPDCYYPLLRELDQIKELVQKTGIIHTVLIDDRRLMRKTDVNTPDSIGVSETEVLLKLLSINPNYRFFYEDKYGQDDVIVATV